MTSPEDDNNRMKGLKTMIVESWWGLFVNERFFSTNGNWLLNLSVKNSSNEKYFAK